MKYGERKRNQEREMEMKNEVGGRSLSTTSSRDGIGGGSNRIVALEVIASNLNNSNSNNTSSSSDHHYHSPYYSSTQEIEIGKPGWRKFLSYVGPGFLIAIVYLDPGNFATDLQAGANHGYQLLWVMLIGTLFSLIIQSLAVNIGVTTGKHLSELCKVEYPLLVKYCLWLVAEVVVIAADIPEVVGTAFALNILFNIPVWAGVLLTGFTTLLLLSLQKYGVRKLEMLISVMILVIGLCFFVEMGIVKPSTSQVLKGMFVPNLSGHHTIADVIALLGAIITPQNLFFHSALVLSRKVPNSMNAINDACKFFLVETSVALLLAFLINVAIVSVSATVCSANNLSNEDLNRCNDLNLNSASFLLKNALGRRGKTMYAIALLASGQSTAVAGTFAGQFIMQGFLDMRMKAWKRNIVTRSIAITPSLIVAIISGSSGAGRLIIVASMILAFGLPFALIPLLKFSNSSIKMGPHKSSKAIIVVSWVLAWGIIGINVYYLSTGFVNWLTHNSLPKVAKVLIGIIVFPLMAIYGMAILYLTLRKDTVQTFIETTNNDSMEKGEKIQSSGHIHIVREDLMDMDPTI